MVPTSALGQRFSDLPSTLSALSAGGESATSLQTEGHIHNLVPLCLRVDWMLLYQGMVVLAANQVWWTWEVEDVFKRVKKGEKLALKNYGQKMHQQIDELVTRITRPMKSNDRRKINTVLIIDVHARDIVDKFIRDRYPLLPPCSLMGL